MPEKIDRPLLHQYWWERTNRRGLIEINQTKMADALGVTRRTMTNTMRKMEDEGRIECFERQKQGRVIWRIFDPSDPGTTKVKVKGQKRLMWG